MEGLLWSVRTASGFHVAVPFVAVLAFVLLWCWDYPLLLLFRVFQRAFGLDKNAKDSNAVMLPVLVVIPSLLRKRDELESMLSTVRSVAENGYPGELTIV